MLLPKSKLNTYLKKAFSAKIIYKNYRYMSVYEE